MITPPIAGDKIKSIFLNFFFIFLLNEMQILEATFG